MEGNRTVQAAAQSTMAIASSKANQASKDQITQDFQRRIDTETTAGTAVWHCKSCSHLASAHRHVRGRAPHGVGLLLLSILYRLNSHATGTNVPPLTSLPPCRKFRDICSEAAKFTLDAWLLSVPSSRSFVSARHLESVSSIRMAGCTG
jgi:hypothetical protein